jgi:acyl carrier protein
MSPPPAQSSEWDRFVGIVASVGDVEPSEVREEARLIEDLGFDSLALAELAIALIDQYGMDLLSEGLAVRSWEGTTVGRLFAESQR